MELTNKRFMLSSFFKKYVGGSFVLFLIPFIIFLFAGALLIIVFEKGDVLLFINSFSSQSLDKFFLIVTDIGLGAFVAIIGVLLVFYKFRWSLLVFINLAFVGIFTNLFKKLFFYRLPRPMHHFYYDDFSRFIHDAPLTYFSTFPSGHTMTIYAFCSLIAFLINKKSVSFILFLIALFVGFSRVYLLQHFFIDTYFGALLGFISTILTIYINNKFCFEEKAFLNKGVISYFRK